MVPRALSHGIIPMAHRTAGQAPAPRRARLELDFNDKFSSPGQSRLHPATVGFEKLDQVWGAGLTCPQVVQAYHEAPGQVEGVVESVSEEGRHVEGGQQGGSTEGHDPAAEDHQPHEQEVQQEGLWAWA